jgi:hypothetical protein
MEYHFNVAVVRWLFLRGEHRDSLDEMRKKHSLR